MSDLPVVLSDAEDLRELFDHLDVLGDVDRRLVHTVERHRPPDSSQQLPEGFRSTITRYYSGTEFIAETHHYSNAEGDRHTEPDPKMVLFDGQRYVLRSRLF